MVAKVIRTWLDNILIHLILDLLDPLVLLLEILLLSYLVLTLISQVFQLEQVRPALLNKLPPLLPFSIELIQDLLPPPLIKGGLTGTIANVLLLILRRDLVSIADLILVVSERSSILRV